MLTAVSRLAVSFAPMHAFGAPEAGTGKSKLVDCFSLIAAGHEAPVIAQGKTEEEMEKRPGAALIAGDRAYRSITASVRLAANFCAKP
jgi:putative DNA primase/helicase